MLKVPSHVTATLNASDLEVQTSFRGDLTIPPTSSLDKGRIALKIMRREKKERYSSFPLHLLDPIFLIK